MITDFLTAGWTITAISAGTADIVAQSGITIAAPDASFTPAAGTYTNQSVAYNLLIYENKINWSIKFRIKMWENWYPHSNNIL